MFPELIKRERDIQEILNEEEESFSRTLDRGEKIFQEYATKLKEKNHNKLDGGDVWRLYDTYGFPVDLTRIMAEEAKLEINEAEFEKARDDAKEASRVTKKSGGVELVKLDVHDLGKLEKMPEVPKTNDQYKYGNYASQLALELRLTIFQRRVILSARSRPSTTTRNS